MACSVSNAFTEVKLAPSGNPTTVQIFTLECANFCFAKGMWQELMHTEKNWWAIASSQSFKISVSLFSAVSAV